MHVYEKTCRNPKSSSTMWLIRTTCPPHIANLI